MVPFTGAGHSRQTELEEEFSLHVVCKWLGNTEKVARRHYLKVRDSHFAQASGAGVSPSVQKVTATCSKDSQEVSSVQIKTLETNESPACAMCGEWSLQDSHPPMKTLGRRNCQLNVAQIWLNLSGFWSSLYASQRPGSLMSRSLAFSKLCSGRHAPRVLVTSTRSSAGVLR